MYCGEPIDENELNGIETDIDHIYPRSKTKGDSITNNLVLVHQQANSGKGDKYPIEDGVCRGKKRARRVLGILEKTV
jgi:CRISPR-associated endonuclease Csn1